MPVGIRLARSRTLYARTRETIQMMQEDIRRFFTSNDGFLPFPTTTSSKPVNMATVVLSVGLLVVLVVLVIVNGSVLEMARFEDDWQEFYHKVILPSSVSRPGVTRGVVYTAAGSDVTSLLTSVSVLRSFGCKLPVQVFTFAGEMNSSQVAAIQEMGIDLRRIEDAKLDIAFPVKPDEESKRKYYIKPAAILASTFDRVLYLDSDNFVTADPTFLFDVFERWNYSAVFWPDYWMTNPSQPLYKAMHVQYRREFEFESGQMLIDKQRSRQALNLATYLNLYNSISTDGKPMTGGDNVVYKYLHGDKDTFKFAWNATGTEYYFVPNYPRPVGHGINSSFCGHTMAQSIPPIIDLPIEEMYPEWKKGLNLPPLFLHLNAVKYVGKEWMTIWPQLKEQGPWRTMMQYKGKALMMISSQGWSSVYPGAFPYRTLMHGELPLGTYCIGLGGSKSVVEMVSGMEDMNDRWLRGYRESQQLLGGV